MNSKQLRKAYGILALIAAWLAFACALGGIINAFLGEARYDPRSPGFGGAECFFLILSVIEIIVFSVLLSSRNYKNNIAIAVTGLFTVIIDMLPAIFFFLLHGGASGIAISVVGILLIAMCNFIYYGIGIHNLSIHKKIKNEEKDRLYAMVREAGKQNNNTESGGETAGNKNNEMFFLMFKDYFPADKLFLLRQALANKKEDICTVASLLPLKKPQTVLLFSIFLGGLGVDRFYIGDTGLGIAKLLLNYLTLGIWGFVDIFFCYKKAKEKNLKEIILAACSE